MSDDKIKRKQAEIIGLYYYIRYKYKTSSLLIHFIPSHRGVQVTVRVPIFYLFIVIQTLYISVLLLCH